MFISHTQTRAALPLSVTQCLSPPPPTPSLLGSQTHSHKHARLIVIQQSHQLLGLVYETPVQLATKLSAHIAIHSGHWSHTLFFFPFGCFVLNEGCISLHQLADTVAGWTTNPPTPTPFPAVRAALTWGEPQNGPRITSAQIYFLYVFLPGNVGIGLDACGLLASCEPERVSRATPWEEAEIRPTTDTTIWSWKCLCWFRAVNMSLIQIHNWNMWPKFEVILKSKHILQRLLKKHIWYTTEIEQCVANCLDWAILTL